MAIKQKLGDLLVRDGLITEADLRTMLAQQRQHGGRIGEHLIRVNLCSEEQIAQALARQLNIPFNDMSEQPAPALSKLMPHDKASKFQALPMGNNPFAAPGSESSEEALRMVWAIADILIERGYFTRSELMKKLRG